MEECGFLALHCIVRNWNLAELFGFPSAESQRIDSRAEELESNVAVLKSTNAMMEGNNASLEELVRKLQIEVNVLKGGLKERNANAESGQKKRRI